MENYYTANLHINDTRGRGRVTGWCGVGWRGDDVTEHSKKKKSTSELMQLHWTVLDSQVQCTHV